MGSAPTPPIPRPAKPNQAQPWSLASSFPFGPSIWPPPVFAGYASCKKGAVLNRHRKPDRQALNAPMNADAVRVKAPGSPGFLIGPGRIVPAERQYFNFVDYQRDQIALGLLVSALPRVFDLLAKRHIRQYPGGVEPL